MVDCKYGFLLARGASMLTLMDFDRGPQDPYRIDPPDQWRMTLGLDLDERSVLEGEVLLYRINEQNSTANRIPFH